MAEISLIDRIICTAASLKLHWRNFHPGSRRCVVHGQRHKHYPAVTSKTLLRYTQSCAAATRNCPPTGCDPLPDLDEARNHHAVDR